MLFLMMTRLLGHLPWKAAGTMGSVIGRAAFSLFRFRRGVTLDNLRHAFPDRTPPELERIAAGAYRNYGITLAEMLRSNTEDERTLMQKVRVARPGIAHELLAGGKGLILLSGHFGGWEMLVSGLRLHLGEPMVVIVQHQRNGKIDAFVDERRRRFGNTTVPMGPSVREVLKALQEGKMVAMLGDQSGPRESVFVEFFGRPAATHRGAAAFSLRTGAPILMVFLLRKADGRYDAEFEEVDRSGLTYSEDGILELTRRHTNVLERHIREHPDQWLWMHKRWKHTGYYESHRIPAPEGLQERA